MTVDPAPRTRTKARARSNMVNKYDAFTAFAMCISFACIMLPYFIVRRYAIGSYVAAVGVLDTVGKTVCISFSAFVVSLSLSSATAADAEAHADAAMGVAVSVWFISAILSVCKLGLVVVGVCAVFLISHFFDMSTEFESLDARRGVFSGSLFAAACALTILIVVYNASKQIISAILSVFVFVGTSSMAFYSLYEGGVTTAAALLHRSRTVALPPLLIFACTVLAQLGFIIVHRHLERVHKSREKRRTKLGYEEVQLL